MATHNEIGKKGEAFAVQYLKKEGYEILETNWRYHHKEIDIISSKDNKIIFIEVKTRTSVIFEKPQQAVTNTKIKHLIKAADKYMQSINKDSRYDIITVLAGDTYKILEHIKDAFKPNDLI
jgi:putative endonuclease